MNGCVGVSEVNYKVDVSRTRRSGEVARLEVRLEGRLGGPEAGGEKIPGATLFTWGEEGAGDPINGVA